MAALSSLADSRNMSSIEINVDIKGIISTMEFRVRVKISFGPTTKCSSIYINVIVKRGGLYLIVNSFLFSVMAVKRFL